MRWQWIVTAGAFLFFVLIELVIIINLYVENKKLKTKLAALEKISLGKPAEEHYKTPSAPEAKQGHKSQGGKKGAKKAKIVKAVVPQKRRAREKPKAMLAIILDDWGYTNKNFHYLSEINECIDISVFPRHQYTKEAALYAHSHGKEVMLHLPMEPKNLSRQHWEQNTITTDMDWERITAIAKDAIASVPYVKGANNHMGSKATEDPYVMQAVLSVIKQKGMFWIDSVSTGRSVAGNTADKLCVRFAKRDVFIDNESDIKYIKAQLMKAANLALSKGRAIAIGHDRPNTLKALEQALPEIKSKGIAIVCASRLARQSCSN